MKTPYADRNSVQVLCKDGGSEVSRKFTSRNAAEGFAQSYCEKHQEYDAAYDADGNICIEIKNQLTELETLVYDTAVAICLDGEYSANVKAIAKTTGKDIASIKGVVGSLVKKGRMQAETEERAGHVFKDIWPVNESGEFLSFGEWIK